MSLKEREDRWYVKLRWDLTEVTMTTRGHRDHIVSRQVGQLETTPCRLYTAWHIRYLLDFAIMLYSNLVSFCIMAQPS